MHSIIFDTTSVSGAMAKAHADRPAKKDVRSPVVSKLTPKSDFDLWAKDGALPKPYNWAEEAGDIDAKDFNQHMYTFLSQ